LIKIELLNLEFASLSNPIVITKADLVETNSSERTIGRAVWLLRSMDFYKNLQALILNF
jgi:hypothetical protein